MNDENNLPDDFETDPAIVQLRTAYNSVPLPERSAELRAVVEEELKKTTNHKPQPLPEKTMSDGKGKRSGAFVLTVSLAIVAVAVTLLWQSSSQQQELADLGHSIETVDQSYSMQPRGWTSYGDADVGDSDDANVNHRCVVLGLPKQNEGTSTSDSSGVVANSPTPKPISGEESVSLYSLPIEAPVERHPANVRYSIDGTSNVLRTDIEKWGMEMDIRAQHEWKVRDFAEGQDEFGIVVDGERLDAAHSDPAGGQRFARIYENNFKVTGDHPLSTFSIDVDTASYSKVRQYLQSGQLPPPDAVRIEELVNYFPYEYLPPMGAEPFTAHMEVCECPWTPEHRLARIAIKGQVMEVEDRPHSNLVFLLDVSGSMNQANKLPLVKKGMKMLVERLNEKDRVAIVTYAGDAGLVLDSTTCDEKAAIMRAIDDLQPGGSTAGAAGMTLAYEIARKHFIEKGVNRVLLCTDGDFNVGVSDEGGLVRLAEEQAKHNVFLSILGFGMDNLNDSMLEQVSGKANGMYAFIDTENEARKVLVEQLSGTLVTIAKDVKIQVEFNPAKVKGYRLIGYENRILAAEDFNDDTKDAGEIGAGHNVTALYEVVPADAKVEVEAADIDDLKYQRPAELTDAADSDELLTLKLRYKQPDGDKSTLISFPVDDDTQRFGEASEDFQFAAAVASFGMLLRGSKYAGDATYDAVHEIASSSLGDDEWGYRKEFVELVAKAKALAE